MISSEQKSLVDAAVLTSSALSKSRVVFHVTNKPDAEWLYSQYEPLTVERQIHKTGNMDVGREHYIDLRKSEEHSLSDENPYEWNEKPVWLLVFTPNENFLKRATKWYNDEMLSNIPEDFEVDSIVAEVIYRTQVHEMCGEDEVPIIEFELNSLDKLLYYFGEAGMKPVEVNGLFQLDGEDSAILRTLAGKNAPTMEVDEDEGNSS